MININADTCPLNLNYRELKQFRNLLITYIKTDPNLLPGSTGTNIDKLKPILEKIENTYTEAKEYQMVLCESMYQFIGKDYISITDNGRFSGNNDNFYQINIEFNIFLTVKEIFILQFYTNLFKQNNNILDFHAEIDYMSQKSHIKDNIDTLLFRISSCISENIACKITYDE